MVLASLEEVGGVGVESNVQAVGGDRGPPAFPVRVPAAKGHADPLGLPGLEIPPEDVLVSVRVVMISLEAGYRPADLLTLPLGQ